tara:strand:- start:881 stop:1108 length:228 start_codon:yes stop_codon:yes gene_type:complete
MRNNRRNMETENFWLRCILVGSALLISITLNALLEPSEVLEARESNLYAEMVCLGIETDMAYGWPNYKRLEVQCD